MNLTRCASVLLFVQLQWQPSLIHAQARTAQVTQVLPFASSGVVTTTANSSESDNTGTQNAGGPSGAAQAVPSSVAEAGGKISTDETGATSLVLGNLGAARMGANSEVKVPTSGEGGQSLELLKGKLFLNINSEELKKRDSSEFRLKTPAALLAVKGTRFFTMSMDGKDTIGVHEGSVEVMEPQSGRMIILESGFSVTASPGLLSEPKVLADDEVKLAAEYDDAIMTALPVSFFGFDKKNETAMTIREGKLFKSNQPLYKFSLSGTWIYIEGATISEEGFAEFQWLTNMKNTYRQVLSFCFRGRQFEKFPNDSDAPPILKLGGIRFRYRASNLPSVKLQGLGQHSYDLNHGHGYYVTKNPSAETIISLTNDSAWHEIMLTLRGGVFFTWDHRPMPDASFAAEDINLILNSNTKSAYEKTGKKQSCTLQMKDFEVLVIP